MKMSHIGWLRFCLSALALLLLAVVGGWWWLEQKNYFPPEQHVRQQFEDHRDDYIQFVKLLRKYSSFTTIGGDGVVNIAGDGIHGRVVPEYKTLMGKIGAKSVFIREDGSVEFELWGSGCAVCSDSYMGIRYLPPDYKKDTNPGWSQTVVASLDSTNLPREKGRVATGLYVVPIEPEWYIYRFEYR